MAQYRNVPKYFKVTEEEDAFIKKRMQLLGTKNQSAFLRKMAVDGLVVKLDWQSLREAYVLLKRISNNINQIARRCNETSSLHRKDAEELQKGYQELCEKMETVVRDVSRMRVT